MLLTFWLENVLCATAACYIRRWNFQKWSEAGALYIWLQCAFRATVACNFFISPLATRLRTRRFGELFLRPSQPTNHWKITIFRDFPTIWRTWIFFLFFAFHLSIVSEVWLLCMPWPGQHSPCKRGHSLLHPAWDNWTQHIDASCIATVFAV